MRGSYAVRTAAKYARGGRHERARMRRNGFFGLARRYTDVIRTQDGIFVSTHDQVVARSAFVEGGFDAAQMDRILSTLDVPLAGRTVIDIGANIGTSTVEFIRRGAGQVIAFEPDPGNFELLQHNTLGLPVQCHRMALSSEPGEVEFARNPLNFGDHRVIRSDSDREQGREIVKVPARTLDSFEIDLSAVALVWMDVQGHEARVLAGASHLLASEVPVVSEFWPPVLNAAGDMERLEDLISEHYTTVIDMGNPEAAPAPPRRLAADEVRDLKARYADHFCDLILLG